MWISVWLYTYNLRRRPWMILLRKCLKSSNYIKVLNYVGILEPNRDDFHVFYNISADILSDFKKISMNCLKWHLWNVQSMKPVQDMNVKFFKLMTFASIQLILFNQIVKSISLASSTSSSWSRNLIYYNMRDE